MRTALLALALLLVATSAAEAGRIGESMGSLYLSASPTSQISEMSVTSFVVFEFYIVAELDYGDVGHPEWNGTNGLSAWHAIEDYPAEVIVASAETFPTNAIPLGLLGRNWLVGLGMTLAAAYTPHRLVHLSAMVTSMPAPMNLYLALGPHPEVRDGLPNPGFVDGVIVGECTLEDGSATECARGFAEVGGLWINRVVPIETDGWSNLKARWTR